jgi:putative flippase GtrA
MGLLSFNKLKKAVFAAKAYLYNHRVSIAKYIASGLLSLVLDFLMLYSFTEFLHLYYLLSASLSYFIGFFFNFYINRVWTFKTKGSARKQLLRYGALATFNYFITIIFMYISTSLFGINYMVSKTIVMSVIVLWNFVLFKVVVYR